MNHCDFTFKFPRINNQIEINDKSNKPKIEEYNPELARDSSRVQEFFLYLQSIDELSHDCKYDYEYEKYLINKFIKEVIRSNNLPALNCLCEWFNHTDQTMDCSKELRVDEILIALEYANITTVQHILTHIDMFDCGEKSLPVSKMIDTAKKNSGHPEVLDFVQKVFGKDEYYIDFGSSLIKRLLDDLRELDEAYCDWNMGIRVKFNTNFAIWNREYLRNRRKFLTFDIK